MSVMHGPRSAKRRSSGQLRLCRPSTWKLWQARRRFVIFALVVELIAVGSVVSTAGLVPVTGTHLIWFGVLAALSAVHLEANVRIERMRELATEGNLYVDLKSIWTFAALLVLPPSLVALLIVITYAHSWLRVGRKILPHRWIFSAATVLLGSALGGVILAVLPGAYPALPHGWLGLAAVIAAAVARWGVNSVLLWVALPLLDRDISWRRALQIVFGSPADDLIEFASLSLGFLVAVALTFDAPMLVALFIPILAVHRGLLLRQFENAARRDKLTGLLQPALWRELAAKQLERAARLNMPVSYLIIRVDVPVSATECDHLIWPRVGLFSS